MTHDLNSIRIEFLDLARAHAWLPVSVGLEALDAAGESRKAMLVTPADVDPTPFALWARTSASYTELPSTTFSGVDAQTRVTPHLIAFFPGDRLIDAAEIEVMTRDFFTRPAGSWAVVVAVDSLTTEEEVRLVEGTAWRLLVHDPPSNWTQSQLRDFGVYLWSVGEPAELLGQRIRQDKEALALWLRSAGVGSDVLVARQIRELVSCAEDLDRQQRARKLSTQATRTKELAGTVDNLTEFRSRLNRRLDADAEVLVSEVKGTMREWSGELKQSIDSVLVEAFGNAKSIRSERAQAIVENKLRAAAAAWGDRIAGLIRSHQGDLKRDSESLLDVVDWKIVNEVVTKSGASAGYPEALLVRAFDVADGFNKRGPGTPNVGAPKRQEGAFNRNLVKLGLPVSVGVGLAASLLMRIPVGIPVGIVAGLLSTVAATQDANSDSDLESCRSFAGEKVDQFLSRCVSHFQSETRNVALGLQRRMGTELRKLDELVGMAMQESYVSGGPETGAAAQIENLRKRVEALAN